MKILSCSKRNNKQSGFSLPELIITIAIISLMTGLILVKFSSFNSVTLLQTQAYEIALDLRQSQVFALSVRADNNNTTSFREEYGLYFDINKPQQYIFFQDSGSIEPALYEAGEEIDILTLDTRYEITDICINGGSICNLSNLSISFKRPNFDARFDGTDPGVPNNPSNISSAEIVISPLGNGSATRTIIITSTGQIDIQ